MPKKVTTEEFISRAKEVWGDQYLYDKSIYVGNQKPIIITCRLHGDFICRPGNFLHKHGCPECGKLSIKEKERYTKEQFIQRANQVHQNYYDYSKVSYTNSKTPIIIICPKHGEFVQIPNSHLQGRGCPKCGIDWTQVNKSLGIKDFVERARKVHGDKYDYSKVEYINQYTPITIICPIHGEFQQIPKDHFNGSGCSICGHLQGGLKLRLTTEEFIQKAREVHGDKYDYKEVKYVTSSDSIDIICPKHGAFKQLPYVHLNGAGCPICKESRGEELIRNLLINSNILFQAQYHINNYIIDFYVPKYNCFIEYNGIQHYQSVEHFGGKERFKKQVLRDANLRIYCKENQINLIEIPYTCGIDTINKIISNLNNMKVVSKLLLTIETDVETGDITLLNREVINDDIKPKKTRKSSTKKDENPEPIVTLDSTKLTLTQGAVDLLQVCEDCRIDIKYDKKGKQLLPKIGTDAAFKSKGGNLLSGKNTVRYGGANNKKLAGYGTTFKMEPTEDEGIYWLVGDKMPEEQEVPKELVNIEDELDITNLDTIEEESTDLSGLSYTL